MEENIDEVKQWITNEFEKHDRENKRQRELNLAFEYEEEPDYPEEIVFPSEEPSSLDYYDYYEYEDDSDFIDDPDEIEDYDKYLFSLPPREEIFLFPWEEEAIKSMRPYSFTKIGSKFGIEHHLKKGEFPEYRTGYRDFLEGEQIKIVRSEKHEQFEQALDIISHFAGTFAHYSRFKLNFEPMNLNVYFYFASLLDDPEDALYLFDWDCENGWFEGAYTIEHIFCHYLNDSAREEMVRYENEMPPWDFDSEEDIKQEILNIYHYL